jgi:hypothetical protein
MKMINVLKRLAELDAGSPRIEKPMISETPVLGGGMKQLNVSMPEPDLKSLKQLSGLMESRQFSNTIAECGMPAMGAPMPSTPASLNMTAANGNEIVAMMRGLADIANGGAPAVQTSMPAMGAPMPAMGGMDDMGSMDDMGGDEMMTGQDEMGAGNVSGPTFGDDKGADGMPGGDELAAMVNKLKTGQPVKISTDMPVKVKTTNPVNGADAEADAEADDSKPDEKTDEDARMWDTSPKEKTRDYNPNDFAQMFNKIKDLDVAKAATRADNPLKTESQQVESNPLDEATAKLMAEYRAFTSEGKKAKKDYDGDGKVEAPKDEVWGSRAKAAAKAGKPFKEQTMSQAAKGNEKYGKAGMQALAKAGREGRSLEPVKAKYNKYD